MDLLQRINFPLCKNNNNRCSLICCTSEYHYHDSDVVPRGEDQLDAQQAETTAADSNHPETRFAKFRANVSYYLCCKKNSSS